MSLISLKFYLKIYLSISELWQSHCEENQNEILGVGNWLLKKASKLQHKNLVSCLLDVSLYFAMCIFRRPSQHRAWSLLVLHKLGGEEEALPSPCITHNAVITELRHWLLQGFSQFLCQNQNRLFFHMQYGPNALILVSLQSAEGFRSQREVVGRVPASATRQSRFPFIALAGQPDKFIAMLMARFRLRKKRGFFFRLDQKILPLFCLHLLNLILTASECLGILPYIFGGTSLCPAASTGQILYWPPQQNTLCLLDLE